jgi:hypothetical protein
MYVLADFASKDKYHIGCRWIIGIINFTYGNWKLELVFHEEHVIYVLYILSLGEGDNII